MTISARILILIFSILSIQVLAATDSVINLGLSDIDKLELTDNDLAGIKEKGFIRGNGWVEWEFEAVQEGIYELWIETKAPDWEQKYYINDALVIETPVKNTKLGNEKDFYKVCNVKFNQGVNKLKIFRDWHPGIAWVKSVKIVRTENPKSRVIVKFENHQAYWKKGDVLKVKITAEPLNVENYRLDVLCNIEGKIKIIEVINVKSKGNWFEKKISIPIDFEGKAEVLFKVNDKYAAAPLTVYGIDTDNKPLMSEKEAKWILTEEIDCREILPELQSPDGIRKQSSIAGEYIESGDSGLYINRANPSWFAYNINIKKPGSWYRLEIDYPDDNLRTFTVSFFDQYEFTEDLPHPIDGGIVCGGEYPLSNKMQTYAMHIVPRQNDFMLFFLTWQKGLRATVSRIRIYELEGELDEFKLSETTRSMGFYYEEPMRWMIYYGAKDNSLTETVNAADKYAKWCRHVGVDTIWDTATVYGQATWASDVLDGNRKRGQAAIENYTSPPMRIMLLTAEKNGLSYVPELQPSPRGLQESIKDLANGQDIYTRDTKGQQLLNPLHPAVQEWASKLVVEVARTCADSTALKGVSLRWMDWQMSGWIFFNGYTSGFDDYSIKKYEKELKTQVPEFQGEDRFAKRYEWLKNNQWSSWQRWRSISLARFYKRLVGDVRLVRSDLKLYINFFETPDIYGVMYPDAFSNIEGLVFIDSRRYPFGRREYDPLNIMPKYSPKLTLLPNQVSGELNAIGHYNEYMEADIPLKWFNLKEVTKKEKVRVCAIVVPAGRHYLSRYCEALAAGPQDIMFDGGLGYTQGQPEMFREFIRQYKALPKTDYKNIGGSDPVALWVGSEYGYIVNRCHLPISVKLIGNDLKVNAVVKKQELDVNNISLEPYELMVFKIVSGRVSGIKTSIDETDLVDIKKQIAEGIKILQIDVDSNKEALMLLEKAENSLQAGLIIKARQLMMDEVLLKAFDRAGNFPEGFYLNKN